MKDLFLLALGLLKTVPGLNWIAKDNGELEQLNPPVAFPCGLIKIEFQQCQSIGGNLQNCMALITVKLGFQLMVSETSAAAPDASVQASLAYYDIVDAVYTAFQGYTDDNVNEFDRTNAKESINKAGYTIMQIPFATTFTDETALGN